MNADFEAIVDAGLYMVLATAGRAGQPWATPVYFAHHAYREFVWVSQPGARHSRNIEDRPEVGIVIFDSSVPIGTGQGAYVEARAEQVTGDARLDPLAAFSERSLAHGGRAFTTADVEPPAALRLYRAVAVEQYILDEHDERIPIGP
jgi:nitroimidazol reductase NimA-like FMN-containing flavoprotein (pyridoxamine 5'-phosphate oxidase superfamily)